MIRIKQQSLFRFLITLTLSFGIWTMSAYAQISSCDGKIQQLTDAVNDYEFQAGHSKSSAADQAFDKVSSLLKDEADQKCQYVLLLNYTLKSINVNSYSTTNEVRDFYSKKKYTFPQPEIHRRLSKLVTILAHQNKIKFLTRDYREKQGPRWSATDAKGNYLLMGAYDCESSTIYIDPYLRPLDFAVTLYHELDHMIRDKLTDAATSGFAQGGTINWKLYNFADELSAIGYSAGLQLDLQDVPSSVFSSSPFEVKNDFTVFSAQGVFRDFADGELRKNRQAPSSSISTMVSQPQRFTDHQAEDINRIFSTIWTDYFPSSEMPENLTKTFSIPAQFMTLSSWLNSNFDPAQIGSLISSESNSCKLYRGYLANMAENQQIDSYLGAQFATGNTDSGDYKPSIRPCLRTQGL